MLAGMMLGPVRGGLAVALLLFLVALGLPFLAGGRGGIGVFYGMTAGYLAGYFFWSGCCWRDHASHAQYERGVWCDCFRRAGRYCCGACIWRAGAGLQSRDVTGSGFMVGSLPFIPGDLIKVALATLVAHTIARGLPSAMLSRS